MKVFIAGSASENIDNKYYKDVEKLANYLLEKDIEVILCADSRGIVGKIFNKFINEKSNKLILTVPKIYLQYTKNINHNLDIITDTISERTEASIVNSDIILILPGGIGSMYEFLHCLETKRAGEHNKKVILFNQFGYFDELLSMINKSCNLKFTKQCDINQFNVVNSLDKVIELLEE